MRLIITQTDEHGDEIAVRRPFIDEIIEIPGEEDGDLVDLFSALALR